MKLNDALNIKTEKRIAAIKHAEELRAELHARLPRIYEIDTLIQSIPMRMLAGENSDALKNETAILHEERIRILSACGYEPDYDVPKFECPDCNDGGYIGLKLCHCVKAMLASENYQESKLAGGLLGKTFDNFSLDYYAEGEERERMGQIVTACKKFAAAFPDNSYNGIFFYGGTGLGKTHLSAAIAQEIVAKGYSVIYESAQQIYDTLDAVRFNRLDLSERKKYETCSLLIIDDLGAECISQYSISALTSLIDLRIVNGKKTIISSNLDHNGIKKTYNERLYSRLLGEFRVLRFMGKDIRMQKIKGC